jgi:hypothetical protein
MIFHEDPADTRCNITISVGLIPMEDQLSRAELG